MPRKRSVERLSRNRIVDVAARHIIRDGYRDASLNEMARDLGVVKGALYYYFPGGKRELLDAVMHQLDEDMYSAMVAAADAEPDPRRALVQAVEGKLTVLADRRDRLGLRREVVTEIIALLGQREREFTRRERALFEAILARGEAAGVFRAIKPRPAAAAAIQAMIRAVQGIELFDVRGQPGGAPSILAPVFELFLRGLNSRS